GRLPALGPDRTPLPRPARRRRQPLQHLPARGAAARADRQPRRALAAGDGLAGRLRLLLLRRHLEVREDPPLRPHPRRAPGERPPLPALGLTPGGAAARAPPPGAARGGGRAVFPRSAARATVRTQRGEPMSLVREIASLQDYKTYEDLHWEGSFEDYLNLVRKNPRVTRNAFQRMYDMVLGHGVEEYIDNKKKLVRYKFFSDDSHGGTDAVFGLDVPLMRLMSVLRSA